MGILDKAVDIAVLGQSELWVLWGKSNSGKTEVLSTFPKPIMYLRIGDDGTNTIAGKNGIKAIAIDTPEELKEALLELQKDKKYATVAVDTFSMYANVWQDVNVLQKKKRMTQQAWGDLGTDMQEIVRLANKLAKNKCVVLTCHEVNDSIEGMDDEYLTDVRPNVPKSVRSYLEGMANYGIHTTKFKKTVVSKKTGEEKDVVRYGAHLGANPYYWTKFQVDKSIELPEIMLNPTYDKIKKLISGGNE